jgi:hypothetical protein
MIAADWPGLIYWSYKSVLLTDDKNLHGDSIGRRIESVRAGFLESEA